MYALFDIGGTNLRLAISRDGKQFSAKEIYTRPKDFAAAVVVMNMFCQKNIDKNNITGIAGSIAGTFDVKQGVLASSPNIKEWQGKPIKNLLEDAFKMSITLGNDADTAGLGEAVYGAGKDSEIVVYLTISTGVGGTRIVNKTIDKNAWGFEPGHQIIEMNGKACSCGGKGHLEAYVSGAAVQKDTGKKPYDITETAFWQEKAKLLAIGLHNTIMHWSPDMVVLGGSMMKQVGIPLDSVRAHLQKLNTMFFSLPRIEKSMLGDDSGLYGALALLNEKSDL